MEMEQREIAERLEAAATQLEKTLHWLEEKQGVLSGEVERISATVEQSRREVELAEKLAAAEKELDALKASAGATVANPMRRTGALLSKGAFAALKDRINPERYGGAPLLGLRGNILKAHGSSNRNAIKSAIRAAGEIIKADMNQRMEADIARANDVLIAPVIT